MIMKSVTDCCISNPCHSSPSSCHDAPDSHGVWFCRRPRADGGGVTAGADEPAGPPHGEVHLRMAPPAGFPRWFSRVTAVSSGRLAGPADQHAGDEPSPAADAGAAAEAAKGAAKGQRGGEDLETQVRVSAEEPHALPLPSVSIAAALQVQIQSFSAKVHQLSSIRGIAPQLVPHTVSHHR